MPSAVVTQGEATAGEVPVDERPVIYGYGRARTFVQVIGDEVRGRRFIRVLRGLTANSMYHLPVEELFIPPIQPCVEFSASSLPYDHFERRVMDDPDSPTCPHALASNKELDYDEDLGLWVHVVADCRRPQAAHLRTVMRVDGGLWP